MNRFTPALISLIAMLIVFGLVVARESARSPDEVVVSPGEVVHNLDTYKEPEVVLETVPVPGPEAINESGPSIPSETTPVEIKAGLPDIALFTPTVELPGSNEEVTNLPLPEVTASEMTLSDNGVATFDEYFDHFVKNASSIAFDTSVFSDLPKNESGFLLLPAYLIEIALKDNDFSDIQIALPTMRTFVEAKIEYLQAIPVTKDAIELNTFMIGADRLLIDLIDDALAAADGSLSSAELEQRYDVYQETVSAHGEALQTQAGVAYRQPTLFDSTLAFLGIRPQIAHAGLTGIGFGGFITFIFECACLGGVNLIMTPGFDGISGVPGIHGFYLSFATMFSPLLYLKKMPFIGHWMLGNYLPIPAPCLSGAFCVPNSTFTGEILFAGTS